MHLLVKDNVHEDATKPDDENGTEEHDKDNKKNDKKNAESTK